MRRLLHASTLLLAALAFVPSASATTFAVNVSPAGFGTVSAPKAQALTLALDKISQGSNGKPTKSLIGVTEQLPTSFADELGEFATCPVADFNTLGPNPPNCPAGSDLGTTQFSAYVPSLSASTTTSAGYIYKVGTGQLRGWVHISKIYLSSGVSTSINLSIALVGKVTTGTTSAGPVIDWNLTPAVDMGVNARITDFTTTWAVNSDATSKVTKKKPTKKKKKKSKKKKRKTEKKKAVRTQVATQTVSASTFESTSCPSAGTWAFSAALTYQSAPGETVTDSIPCATGGTKPTSSPTCVQVLLLLCVPVNAVSRETPAL